MRGQKGLPKPTEASENEMRCPQPDTNADKFRVQERHTADDNNDGSIFPPPFLASTPIIFYNKLEGDSICLWYKSILVRLTSPRKERLGSVIMTESVVIMV